MIRKSLDSSKLQLFTYTDATNIVGDNTVRVADLRTGKILRTINLHKIEMDKNGEIVNIIESPVEISNLSKLIGRKAIIYSTSKKGKRICESIRLSYNFPGESIDAATNINTGRSQAIMSNECECHEGVK